MCCVSLIYKPISLFQFNISPSPSLYAFTSLHFTVRLAVSLWAALLEKALAKVYGGYDGLLSLSVGEILFDLLGPRIR